MKIVLFIIQICTVQKQKSIENQAKTYKYTGRNKNRGQRPKTEKSKLKK
jgi:hypothetical protein